MISFILANFEVILMDIELYGTIRNIQYGLPHSSYHLFNILEMYNPKSGTFFTPIGELGFALHEMFEVSLELPYEEIVPTSEELRRMKTQDPQLY